MSKTKKRAAPQTVMAPLKEETTGQYSDVRGGICRSGALPRDYQRHPCLKSADFLVLACTYLYRQNVEFLNGCASQ